ncbi:uncharacterized protein LAESUDRAFT_718502 [Laetiporus sulphureus 93-53]|uniref:Uncharacterized protein n=1 Tax=Laetiporus sulphureus 93-53 TaxID=1314785 RepID=A0A165AWB2_9APHY|nr:uncharacterized protein LAESUDRAFT_718502 [Laetiporus sulphureus 93-53]KZS99781.1 hypothetical protein LAESUDRAFT_718502 [Laetiporus sulphureus 93-53]
MPPLSVAATLDTAISRRTNATSARMGGREITTRDQVTARRGFQATAMMSALYQFGERQPKPGSHASQPVPARRRTRSCTLPPAEASIYPCVRNPKSTTSRSSQPHHEARLSKFEAPPNPAQKVVTHRHRQRKHTASKQQIKHGRSKQLAARQRSRIEGKRNPLPLPIQTLYQRSTGTLIPSAEGTRSIPRPIAPNTSDDALETRRSMPATKRKIPSTSAQAPVSIPESARPGVVRAVGGGLQIREHLSAAIILTSLHVI